MVRRSYLGMRNPRAELEKLRDAREHVIALMQLYPPMGEDYRALLAIADAILAAGYRFVPEDRFLFARKPLSS